jgi:hypothetical protein
MRNGREGNPELRRLVREGNPELRRLGWFVFALSCAAIAASYWVRLPDLLLGASAVVVCEVAVPRLWRASWQKYRRRRAPQNTSR